MKESTPPVLKVSLPEVEELLQGRRWQKRHSGISPDPCQTGTFAHDEA